ncbi:MAG: hypothetical protein ABIY70_07760, partial [Capsulimonas sp.]|uniref:WD40 repeat domain-containing protein n=1 Tax=Capsulimonas sp. TaxID=2494211 RepID=UPI003267BE76
MFTFVRKHRRLSLALGGAIVILAIVLVRRYIFNASLAPRQFVQSQGEIDSIQFSHDGSLVMTTDALDCQVTFRDPANGRIVREWAYSGGETWLSNDGARVLATKYSPDRPTQSTLYNAVTGRALRRWNGQVVDVLPDFSLMVIGEDGATRSVAKVSGSQPAQQTTKPTPAPRGGRVVDVLTGRVLGVLPEAGFRDAILSRDGRYLCVVNGDKPALLLRVPEMTPIFSMPSLSFLRVARDGDRALGVDGNTGVLHLWLLSTGLHTTVDTGLNQLRHVYSLDDGSVVVQGDEGTRFHSHAVLQVRSADGERLLRSLPMDPLASSWNAQFAGVNEWNGHGSDAFNVFDLQSGRRIVRLNMAMDALGQTVSKHDYGEERFAISPDGHRFASAGRNGLLHFYDLSVQTPPSSHPPISTDNGRSVLSLSDGSDGPDLFKPDLFEAVALPGGGVAASGRHDDPQQIKLWRSGKEQILGGRQYQVARFQVSQDGGMMAVLWNGVKREKSEGKSVSIIQDDGFMDLRDTHTGRLIRTLIEPDPNGVTRTSIGALSKPVFSRDGKFLAVAGDSGGVLVFDTVSGRKMGQLSETRVLSTSWMGGFVGDMFGAAALAFAPDNQSLAAARDDGAIYLYSLKTFLPVAQIGHTETVSSRLLGRSPRPLRWVAFDARGDKLYGI